jgi:D-2-hydroxyacid dehydrogenase (NADP+)
LEKLNVIILADLPHRLLAKIAAFNPQIRVIDARHQFDVEMFQSWPEATLRRYLSLARPEANPPPEKPSVQKRRENDALLAKADVVCIGFPYPLELVSRAPHLKWIHHTSASASNLRFGDIYRDHSIILTTSRGHNKVVPIAEYVIASILSFAKDIPLAVAGKPELKLERQDYHPILVQGKSLAIVGLGGIGREVARLARGLGMRVLATRRSAPEQSSSADGVDLLFPSRDLNLMLEQSDFIALCAQYTPETERMIGEAQFKAMKPTSILVNIARGELIDEDALVKALRENRIRGAILDVYSGEFERPLRDDLKDLPNLIVTPHISGRTDVPSTENYEFFYENLIRFVEGTPLLNVVDRERGY